MKLNAKRNFLQGRRILADGERGSGARAVPARSTFGAARGSELSQRISLSTPCGPGRPALLWFRLRRPGTAPPYRHWRRRAFTLIELMVVIGIMAVVMGMGVPAIYRIWHKDAMAKALTDVQEVFSHARARAILQGIMTEVVFHPKEGRLELASGARPAETHPGIDSENSPPPPSSAGLSAQISDRLTIEMLDINLTEYKDAEIARIRFYPNGMCDEATLILHSDQNEWRKLSLEVTTGLATVGDVAR